MGSDGQHHRAQQLCERAECRDHNLERAVSSEYQRAARRTEKHLVANEGTLQPISKFPAHADAL